MVNSSTLTPTSTGIREIVYPAGTDSLPELTRWLNTAADQVEDGAAAGGLVLTVSGGTRPARRADVAAWTRWEKAVSRLERLPVATAAAVDGSVQGPAFGLLLACDITAATPSTVLSCGDLDQGWLPGMALFRLAKFTGLGQARRMVLTRKPLPAADAVRAGLVTEVSTAPGTTARSLLERYFRPGDVNWYLARRLLAESYAHHLEDALGGVLAAQERALREHTP
jgi:isomerase DpgB